MSELLVVVEGAAEQVFVRDVLAPWLGHQGVYAKATPIHGNKYTNARTSIVNFLKQRDDTFVTCLFDFYGMKHDWPGREHATSLNYDNRPLAVESGAHQRQPRDSAFKTHYERLSEVRGEVPQAAAWWYRREGGNDRDHA